MIKTCAKCNRLLCEGDRVRADIESTYHVLKSTVAYALDRNDMEVVSPLEHVHCEDTNGN